MGLFRSRKSRQVAAEPLPDWDDTRWRSHLRANALGTDHHCGIYLEMINADRKEAARLFKNEDDIRARGFAESALRNKRIVSALSALSPLCNALFQRSEPLAGYTSLVQIPEPARSGIVTLIFAAGRLHLSYLTDTVTFLLEQFGSVHIDAIQSSQGDLTSLVNPTVLDSLSPTAPDRSDVDAELASAVKEYFGVTVNGANTATVKAATSPGALRGQAGTPIAALSAHSSELGGPQSPHISASSAVQARNAMLSGVGATATATTNGRNLTTPSPPRQKSLPGSPGVFVDAVSVPLTGGKHGDAAGEERDSGDRHVGDRVADPEAGGRTGTPLGLLSVDDSDDLLVRRYHDLRAVIAV